MPDLLEDVNSNMPLIPTLGWGFEAVVTPPPDLFSQPVDPPGPAPIGYIRTVNISSSQASTW